MEIKEPEVKKPIILFSIVIDVYANGDRQLRVEKDKETVDPPLSYMRELFNWAKDFVNDKLNDVVLKAQLNALLHEKIIKPGFRPMNILNKLRGK